MKEEFKNSIFMNNKIRTQPNCAKLFLFLIFVSLAVLACASGFRVSSLESDIQWTEFGGDGFHSFAREADDIENPELLFRLKLLSMVGSTVVTGDNTVFCCTQKGYLQAYDLTKGKLLGKIKIKYKMISAPVYDNHTLYFAAVDGRFTINSFDAVRGRFNWRKNLGVFESALTVSGDNLFAANRSGLVYNLDKESGDIVWEYQADSEILSGTIVVDDLVIFGSLKGIISALDKSTGEEVWQYNSGMILRATPSSDGSRIFWGTLDNTLLALDARSGSELWRFNTNGAIYTTPSVTKESITFGCNDGKIYSIDKITGEERWRFDTETVVNTSCITIGSTVYFGALNKMVYGLDAVSGKKIWEFPVEGRVVANPAYYDGKLIFPVESRFLYVFGQNKN